ncbi:LOW QUALITY PROTEIN: uncharacterized protein LOC128254159 [Drosophila gunungcola]|uniref:LOW QUALITY PROTEIN: uncharacterized protein LOC128254159 n=1 Tax=Drosophila gunungcola TaxID=103775 RepID=UPI0022E174F4|nr:LOW QUALITY PROTEIN: uncharacterized protein LOC128254159 [Drosophila gunungcola]
MSFIRNLLDSPNGWTQLNRNINEMRGLNSCFYFFGLKTGCKLIAVFEALVNVLQMCSIYKAEMEMEVGLGTTTTESLDSLMVTREPDGDMLGPNTTMPIFETNLYFSKTLHSLTVLRSLLLFVGAEWGHISCLVLWICITVITVMISTLIEIMQETTDLQKLFICTLSIFLEIYFCAVVSSLILKLQKKLRPCVQETVVLFTQSEEA